MKRKAWKVPAGSRAVGSRRGRGRRVRGGLQLRCPSQLSTRRRPAQQLPGPGPQQGQLAAGSRAVEGARRGRLKEGAWRAEGRGDPSAQLPEPLSPGSRRRSVLSPPGSFSAQEPVRSSRSPPLLRPGGWLGPESRAVRSGMPRYELALILKAMQRVSDLPLRVRLPARGPTAVRPSCPALPARPGRRASALRGRVWVGRLGEAACAREAGVCPRGSAAAGGCALHAAGRPGTGGGAARGSQV